MIKITISSASKISGETKEVYVDKEWNCGRKLLHTPKGELPLASEVDIVAGQVLVSDDYELVICSTMSKSGFKKYGEFWFSSTGGGHYMDASVSVYSKHHQKKLEEAFAKMKKHIKPIR